MTISGGCVRTSLIFCVIVGHTVRKYFVPVFSRYDNVVPDVKDVMTGRALLKICVEEIKGVGVCLLSFA
jgi:hypothetical protein